MPQILDSELPRSSGIWAEIAEIAAYCTRFPTSAEYNWEVLEMHHPLMQAARSFSLPCSQGPKVSCDPNYTQAEGQEHRLLFSSSTESGVNFRLRSCMMSTVLSEYIKLWPHDAMLAYMTCSCLHTIAKYSWRLDIAGNAGL